MVACMDDNTAKCAFVEAAERADDLSWAIDQIKSFLAKNELSFNPLRVSRRSIGGKVYVRYEYLPIGHRV